MLTLDSAKVSRQRRWNKILEARELQRQRVLEAIAKSEATVAPDGEIDTTCLAQQLGTPLHSSDFVRRLERCNPSLTFEVSNNFPDHGGIYAVGDREDETGAMRKTKYLVVGTTHPFMPERSVRHMKPKREVDPDNPSQWKESHTFERETRGWRTVLRALLAAGFITKPQIERHFPPEGGISRNWQRLTT